VCIEAVGCIGEPISVCRHPTITNAARLSVARPRSGPAHFEWTLRSGPATARDELGDPLAGTGYALCGLAGDGRVVLRAVAPAGPCPRGACWRRTRRGFTFADRRATDGLDHLTLQAGSGGRTRFFASGGRSPAVLPALPADPGLRIELRRLDDPAICWAAEHGTVRRNTTRRYRAMGE
jgi:hypothetical protein